MAAKALSFPGETIPPDEQPVRGDFIVRLLSSTVHLRGVPSDITRPISRIYPGLLPSASLQGSISEDAQLDMSESFDASCPHRMLGEIEQFIDEAAFEQLGAYVMFHAGVVAAGDAGILLPAASGAGKSTLVAALYLSGFRYLSDEFAVMCPTTRAIHPYPKSICLKTSGWELIDDTFDASASPVNVQRPDGRIVHFLPAQPMPPDERGSVARYVLIPDRQIGGPARLTRITQTEALTALMQQSLNLPWHGPAGLDALAGMVESADSYRLTYSDLRGAVTAITNLVTADTGWSSTP